MAGPHKELGQHLLSDAGAIRRVIEAADLQPGQRVLDAGAGAGALALPIAAAVGPTGHVFAIEIDPQMLRTLRGEVPTQVQIIQGDLLDVALPEALDAVVANPPFKIAAPFIERMLAAGVPRAVLVLPRELAERLTAAPGSSRYGKLTVRVALQAHVEEVGAISRYAFAPPPTVACGLVRLQARPDAPTVDPEVLDQVLDAARAAWEKKAKHAFGPLAVRLRADSAGLTRLLRATDLTERRTSELTPDEFAAVAQYLQEHGRAA